MKKYFMKGTDDEVLEGDMIEVTLVGEEDGVTKHSHLELKFMPEFAESLIEEDIIEEREVEDEEEDLIDYDDYPCEELVALMENFESLKKRVSKLEELCKALSAAGNKKTSKKK